MTVMTNHRYGIWEHDSIFALYEITGKLGHAAPESCSYIRRGYLCLRACVCPCNRVWGRDTQKKGEVENYCKVQTLPQEGEGEGTYFHSHSPHRPVYAAASPGRLICRPNVKYGHLAKDFALLQCSKKKEEEERQHGNSVLLAFRGWKDSQE